MALDMATGAELPRRGALTACGSLRAEYGLGRETVEVSAACAPCDRVWLGSPTSVQRPFSLVSCDLLIQSNRYHLSKWRLLQRAIQLMFVVVEERGNDDDHPESEVEVRALKSDVWAHIEETEESGIVTWRCRHCKAAKIAKVTQSVYVPVNVQPNHYFRRGEQRILTLSVNTSRRSILVYTSLMFDKPN